MINKLKPSPCISCPSQSLYKPAMKISTLLLHGLKILKWRGENSRSPQTKVQVVLIHRLELWARVSSGLQPRVWNISQLVSQHLTRGLTHIPDMTRGHTKLCYLSGILLPLFFQVQGISLLLWTGIPDTCVTRDVTHYTRVTWYVWEVTFQGYQTRV